MTNLRGGNRRRVQLRTGRVGHARKLDPRKVRCVGCGGFTTLTPTGRLRAHNTPAGDRCARKVNAEHIDLDVLPPVVLPPAKPYRKVRDKEPHAPRTHRSEPSRLEAGSHCRDCGRWLPGERSLCGRCANHREEDRR